ARCAAAALVATAPARRGAGRPHDPWTAAAALAPELAEEAAYFAVAGGRRVAVEAGRARVSVREADDLLRAAEGFVDLVAARLGLPVHHDGSTRLAPIRSA
ncbi:MAG TPA: SAV_6107 family HEPN domain-containing protein, partial [Dermatophilaceae bacterium]|nr:SAV_6107 family HEPN domain-containing protein [Dermatophilaceae bacterium]